MNPWWANIVGYLMTLAFYEGAWHLMGYRRRYVGRGWRLQWPLYRPDRREGGGAG